MTEVITDDYQGPERRRYIEQCICHLKHEAAIIHHTDDIKSLGEQMRTKIGWKLFSLFVSIVVLSTGFLYREIRATGKHMEEKLSVIETGVESRIDSIEKSLQVTIMREQIFEETTKETLSEIKLLMRDIDSNVRRHLEDVEDFRGSLPRDFNRKDKGG